jgi:hypothetical protein
VEKRKSPLFPIIKPQFPGRPAHSLVTKNWLIPAVLHNIVTRDKPSTEIEETLKSQWKKF